MIDEQKDYARDLLTHVNPYTKVPTSMSRPSRSSRSITKTRSIDGMANGGLDTCRRLIGPNSELWTAWLTQQIRQPTKLAAAWTGARTRRATEMLANGASRKASTLERSSSMRAAVDDAQSDAEHGSSPRIDVTEDWPRRPWHVQFNQSGLKFAAEETYTVTFRAKAERAAQNHRRSLAGA